MGEARPNSSVRGAGTQKSAEQARRFFMSLTAAQSAARRSGLQGLIALLALLVQRPIGAESVARLALVQCDRSMI